MTIKGALVAMIQAGLLGNLARPNTRCSACGGPYHEATGHRHSVRTVLCGPCARDFKDWVKRHTARRWGKVKFYDHAAAGVWAKGG